MFRDFDQARHRVAEGYDRTGEPNLGGFVGADVDRRDTTGL